MIRPQLIKFPTNFVIRFQIFNNDDLQKLERMYFN